LAPLEEFSVSLSTLLNRLYGMKAFFSSQSDN